ncbi:hypothetical protein D3C85_761670 [compost metagenome]
MGVTEFAHCTVTVELPAVQRPVSFEVTNNWSLLANVTPVMFHEVPLTVAVPKETPFL